MKMLSLHSMGSAYLVMCGTVALMATPPGGDDALGLMLIANGLCWLALAKAQKWWGTKPGEGAPAAPVTTPTK
jgi:hypothetical protein